VERRRQLALGIYQAKGKAQWVIPHDRTLSENIVVPRHPRAKDGDMVKVRLHREIQGALQGEIIAVLGSRGNPQFETLASAYAEGFADEFDPATLIAAQSVPDHVHPEEIAGRRDLRHLPLVTIDGEDARDFDDAVHVSRTPGGYRLVVAIADVAHYVRPGGPLDREALRRATSVYFPAAVLPMLPERLSNGICSLNPDVDRLCMVCDLALDKSGKPLQTDIYEAVMRSHARLTYTRVAEALGLPTVYRIHDQPDREKLDAFAALARSHGFELPSGDELTPGVLNRFLEAVEGKPAQKALNSLLLRAMMQAQYSPDNIG